MAANVVTGKCCGRNYFIDQITGVLPANPCDSICLTVASSGDLPDPATSCEFALVQDLDAGEQGLRVWDGSSWNPVASVTATFSGGDITEVAWFVDGSWSLTINGETPVVNPYIMPADTSAMTVVFINGACSYTMDEVVAPVVPTARLRVVHNDPASLPFDANDVGGWNGFLYTSFTSLVVTDTTTFELFGGADSMLLVPDFLMPFDDNLAEFTDLDGVFGSIGNTSFTGCDNLALDIPLCTSIDNAGCESILSVTEMPNLVSIASTALQSVAISQTDFPLVTYVGPNAFTGSTITAANFPILEVLEANAFENCASLVSGTFDSLITADSGCWRNTGMVNLQIPVCIEFLGIGASGGVQLFSCNNLSVVYAPLLAALAEPDDNAIFGGISGQNITITVSSVLQTIDAGNPDGDLVYLAANNTATINYV